MGLVFIDSFDHATTPDQLATKYLGQYVNSYSPTAGRRGGGCMSGWYGSINCPMSGDDTVVVGCAREHDGVGDGAAFINTYDSESRRHVYIAETSLGSLSAVVDNGYSPHTVLGRTRNGVIQNGSWYYYEAKIRVHGSDGYVILRVNEVTELTVTSQNTLPAGANAEIWFVQLHDGSYMNGGKLDDVYILDSSGTLNDFLGDVRVEAHFPKANGNSSGWTPSTGANWETTDEHAPNTTDYNSTTTLNALDTLDVEDLKNTGGNIKGVQMLVYHKKNDAGGCLMAPVVRVGGVDYVGADFAPSDSSWRYERRVHEKDPAGSAWSESSFNAAEFGYKKTG